MKKLNYILPVLIILLLFWGCKKKEERDFINNYVGDYEVTLTTTRLDDTIVKSTDEYIELRVKKSLRGIRINGLSIENFEVNYNDSSLSRDLKDNFPYAYGKFFPNDSISLRIYYAKFPNYETYKMKKKL